MKRLVLLAICVIISGFAIGQGFEITGLQETYKGTIGETIKAPIRFKNTSEKPVTVIIRKISGIIGSTQKNFFCLDNSCLDQRIEDYIIKVEPGQFLSNFQVALEAGLVPGISSVKYLAFNKSNPAQAFEFEVNFSVEEKSGKASLYNSRFITLNDVYPNPCTDYAYVDYQVADGRVNAQLRIHNLLGNVVGEYSLVADENMMRIRTDEFSAGIYFYTLYIDGESVLTRKLIVKK